VRASALGFARLAVRTVPGSVSTAPAGQARSETARKDSFVESNRIEGATPR
jgi:hypothetical protein